MKYKLLLSIVFVASCFIFSSCEGLFDNLLGSADIVVTDNNGGTFYAPDGPASDSIHFSSSVSDVITTSDSTFSYLSLCANIDLTTADVISYPYLGILVTDSTATTYAIDALDLDILQNLEVGKLLTTLANRNLVVLAVSDTSWYISNGGNVTIDEFATYGHLTKAQFDNVEMLYFTQSGIDYITDLVNRSVEGDIDAITTLATFNISTCFPPVTLTGTFSSRRMNINGLVTSLAQ